MEIVDPGTSGIVKTIPVIRDWSLNPACDHGPTVLFERNGKRFFSCSAYRTRKLCPFFMSESDWKKVSSRPKTKPRSSHSISGDVDKEPSSKKMKLEKDGHPLELPNQRDKGEAQYHFNEKTVQFIMTQLENLKIDSVLCIGTPSLHENIQNSFKKCGSLQVKSFLLDIDQRFNKAFSNGFALYNMCNHYFFQNREKYEDFLKNSGNLAVILDPPFGVKVELIWYGCLSGVNNDLNQFPEDNSKFKKIEKRSDIKMFWIYPYFMEGHILSKCSDGNFQMSDFHVEYRNHPKYSGSGKNKSSPIRIFTNVPLSDLTLPKEEYRYCELCEKWVDKRNAHCNACGKCTTKDGGPTYNHCKRCKKCVKPSWSHCRHCKTCHLDNSNGDVCSNKNNTFNVDSVTEAKVKKLEKKNPTTMSYSMKKGNYSKKRSISNKRFDI